VKFSDLRDNFDDNTQAAAWSDSYALGSATKAETGGQAVFTLPSSTAGTHEAAYLSGAAYDLTGEAASVNVPTMVATGVAAYAFFRLRIDTSNWLDFFQQSGTLYFRKVVAGVTTNLASVSYSSSTHRWWRIREASGTIFFDTSTNASGGASWTNRASVANPFDITALFVTFGAGCGNVASPGSAKFDDYNAINGLTTAWHWTKQQRPLIDRYRTLTAATTGGQFYVGTSTDDSTYTWWSGPLADDGRTLTSQSSEVAAQAMAINFGAAQRFDLPSQTEARFVKVGHRSIVAATSYRVDELYARRLIQSDDIEAETIKAINIAAGTITADRITAAFTITGKKIQTAESGARVVLSGDTYGGLIGYSASDTYDPSAGTGTYQILWKQTDGKFYFGAGGGMLDATGVNLDATSTTAQYIRWGRTLGASDAAAVGGASSGGLNELFLSARTSGGNTSRVYMEVADGTYQAYLDEATATFRVQADTSAFTGIISGSDQIRSAVSDAGTTTAVATFVSRHRTSGTAAAGLGSKLTFQADSTTTQDRDQALVQAVWATATDASRKARLLLYVSDTALREGMRIEASGSAPLLGFFGAAAVAQQSIGAAAPAGGTGTAAGGWDTAAHRDAAITLLNNIRTALLNLGLSV